MTVYVHCPVCGDKLKTRTSERTSLLTVRSKLYCTQCTSVKVDFVGEITRVQRAVYVDLPEAKTWSKCEKELIQDGVLKNESNAERLANLRKPVLLKGYKAEQHG